MVSVNVYVLLLTLMLSSDVVTQLFCDACAMTCKCICITVLTQTLKNYRIGLLNTLEFVS